MRVVGIVAGFPVQVAAFYTQQGKGIKITMIIKIGVSKLSKIFQVLNSQEATLPRLK